MRDVIVIGGGPAGLSAAAWIARYRRSVALLDAGEQRNLPTHAVHGYLGVDPCAPADLLRRGRDALLAYPHASIEETRVTAVARDDGAFRVEVDGDAMHARRLVLATGVRDVLPEVEGFDEQYGRRVFHCPSCDGYEARDQHVVVFGWGEHVTGFARDLLTWAASVTIVTEGPPLEADRAEREALAADGIGVIEDDAVALLGAPGALEGIRLASGQTIPCGYAFFSFAHVPRTELAQQLGCALDDDGYVTTNRYGLTSVAGVYAAGDVAPGTQLVQIAAAQGATAGIACAISLRGAP